MYIILFTKIFLQSLNGQLDLKTKHFITILFTFYFKKEVIFNITNALNVSFNTLTPLKYK